MEVQKNETNCKRCRQIGRIAQKAVLLAIFLALLSYGYFLIYVNSPGPAVEAGHKIVTIPKGSSVQSIRKILARNQIIHDDFRFLLLAKYSGNGRKLQAGEFELPTGRKPAEILQILATSHSKQYSVTIPEGLNAVQIAEILDNKGWCDSSIFTKLIYDKEFIKKLGLSDYGSLEGFLFPETYFLSKEQQTEEKILSLMVARFQAVWKEIIEGKKEIPDMYKTLILASIVEKETGNGAERSMISGVFHNRLKIGMRLQSDPTVTYGVKSFSGKITKKHLRTKTPYNTYTIDGLPIGPICNPGREALLAVLHPQQTKNLYFVSKNDGTHKFSMSLKEHNRAVQKYQRKNSGKKGK